MNQEESNKKDRIFKIFKLSLGETIICIVLKETTSYVEIQFPFRLNMMHTPHGTINLALSRWDHTIDYNESIRLYKNSIVAVGDTTEDILLNYTRIVDGVFDDTNIEESSNTSEADNLMIKLLQTFNSDKPH